jgi:hypothetical protein
LEKFKRKKGSKQILPTKHKKYLKSCILKVFSGTKNVAKLETGAENMSLDLCQNTDDNNNNNNNNQAQMNEAAEGGDVTIYR